ncbi:hypothetical protein ABT154_04485 [Streptomyces sp. NPDC001728]|uniref:hypothetical protein n=1 Tax=Streptomyces sp. NPDC001728 TaxID=3154396 RepID=UPI0033219F27
MTDLIRALFLWAKLVFGARSGGRHRARTAVWAVGPVPYRPALAPATAPPVLGVPLDGYESALFRLYLLADARQRRRLAPDARDPHGLAVAS